MYRNFKAIKAFVESGISACSVLVIGDVMLDKYYFGEVKRISPEAPVPITRVLEEKETLGGAANVAHNLALLGCKTYLAGVVGNDHHRDSLNRILDSKGVDYTGLICKNGPTTTKLRIIGGHQQMLRLDFEETAPIDSEIELKLKAYVDSLIDQKISSVIISDYAKGICTPTFCQYVIEKCSKNNVPVIIDPKGTNWQKYSGAAYITPNLKELNEAVHIHVPNNDDEIKKAASAMKRRLRIKNILVTRSEKGLSLIGNKRSVHIPTKAQEVFDVSGAGDTVIAVLGAALAGQLDPVDAAYLANLAAGVVVGKLGTYAINRNELIEALIREEDKL